MTIHRIGGKKSKIIAGILVLSLLGLSLRYHLGPVNFPNLLTTIPAQTITLPTLTHAPISTPTLTPTVTPLPTITATPTEVPEIYKLLTREQISEFNQLSSKDKDVLNYMANIQQDYNYDIFSNSLDSALALGVFLQEFPKQQQLNMLTSSLSPLEMKNSNVYIYGLYDMSPYHLALIMHNWKTLGFNTYTFDVTNPWNHKDGVYNWAMDFFGDEAWKYFRPAGHVLNIVQQLLEIKDGPEYEELRQLSDLSLDEMTEYLANNPLPPITRGLSYQQTLSGMLDNETGKDNPIFIHYLGHMHLGEDNLAYSSFSDLYSPEELLPNNLLDKIGGPLVIVLESCPETIPSRLQSHLDNHGGVDYIIIYGDTQDDPYRLIPLGQMSYGMSVAIYQSESDGTNLMNSDNSQNFRGNALLYHPSITLNDWNAVFTGAIQPNSTDGFDSVFTFRPWEWKGDTKVPASAFENFTIRTTSHAPDEHNRDNYAIPGLKIRTNMDDSIYSIPLANYFGN